MSYACAVAPKAPMGLTSTPGEADDWLSMPEVELQAMHAESLALFLRPATAALAGRAAASLALLHQLMLARGVAGALGQSPAELRAAMRTDHALGYFFGLAAGVDGSTPERRVAGILVMLHDIVFGRRLAEQLTADLLDGGTAAVGTGFGGGMLAAGEDLAALERWRRGEGGALPGGLLDGLPWPRWAREPASDLRH